MQRGFTKLFNTIVTSTIWREDDQTRIVWITMLAIADQHGVVSASLPGLAAVANVSVEAAERAIAHLSAPDEWSRTQDFDGRRIEPIDGGWRVLNYVKYRSMLTTEERKEYKAKWARESRRQSRQKVDSVDRRGQTGTTPSASASASASEDWLSTLSKDSTYQGIDVGAEFGKMSRWCEVNHKEPTKRRFVNWLNRADKPIRISSIDKEREIKMQRIQKAKESLNGPKNIE